MKTIKNVQLIACMLVALYASGFNTIPNRFSSSSVEEVYSTKKIKVVIKNAKGKVVKRGKMEATQTVQDLFELELLPMGDYIIEMIYDQKIEFLTFSVKASVEHKGSCDASQHSTTEVVFGDSYEIFKPVMMNRGNLIYVSKMAFEEEELEIKIYNEYNELIFTETFNNSGRVYDFSKIKNDKLKFVVMADGRKYVETFKF